MGKVMCGLKQTVAACGFALLIAGPAIAEDLSIDLAYLSVPEPANKGFARLFISSTDVRYRTRFLWAGNQDWLFNVASGKLLIIDHVTKQYSESTPAQREERDRLEREEVETRLRVPTVRDGRIETQLMPAHEGRVVSEREAEKSCDGHRCDRYVVWTDVLAGPQEPKRRDRVAIWAATVDLQAPTFFKFQDAVRYELCEGPVAWRQASARAYDELKSKGLFPLASDPPGELTLASLGGFSMIPTYGAGDMLFHPTAWAGGNVRNDVINPAIFTVVETDSILSPVLPASYKKVDPPIAMCIESDKKHTDDMLARLKELLRTQNPPTGEHPRSR
jgi:hypothetical protein